MSDSAAAAKATLSLIALAPAGMVTLVAPPKVTRRSDEVSTDEPPVLRARWMSPMVTGALPKALDSWMRVAVPEMLVCTIWRSVCRSNDAPPLCGEADQVPVQAPSAVVAGVSSAEAACQRPVATTAVATSPARAVRPSRFVVIVVRSVSGRGRAGYDLGPYGPEGEK